VSKIQRNVQVIGYFYDTKGNNVGGPYKGTVNPTVLKGLQLGAFSMKPSTSIMKGTPTFLRLEYQKYYHTLNYIKKDEFTYLFDGQSTDGWRMAGPGKFVLVGYDRSLQSQGGMGLLWYTKKKYKDFVLKVDWKLAVEMTILECLSDFQIQTTIL
jgi:Domain of Unknown Function (DUF1080)